MVEHQSHQLRIALKMCSPEPEVGRGTNVWATSLPFVAIVEIQNSEVLEVCVTSTIVSHQYDCQYLEDLRSMASTGGKNASLGQQDNLSSIPRTRRVERDN